MNEGWQESTFAFGARKLKEQWRANTPADPFVPWHDNRKQDTDCVTTVEWFTTFVMFIGVVTKVSRCLVTTSLSQKAKRKHVALSRVKMDCRCRKLSPFFCQFLSAVGELKKDCRHTFEQCRLSPKQQRDNHSNNKQYREDTYTSCCCWRGASIISLKLTLVLLG